MESARGLCDKIGEGEIDRGSCLPSYDERRAALDLLYHGLGGRTGSIEPRSIAYEDQYGER